jgi:hypothetical protein
VILTDRTIDLTTGNDPAELEDLDPAGVVDLDLIEQLAAEAAEAVDVQAAEAALPKPIPAQWKQFTWPSWVPLEVRQPIEQFFSRPTEQGPQAWVEDAERTGSYPLGVVVTLADPMGSWPGRPSASVTGRWVHAWRGTGRIVCDDGSWTYAYFTAAQVQRWWAEVERHRQVHDDPATAEQLARQQAEQEKAAAAAGSSRAPEPQLPVQDTVPCRVCGVPVAPAYVAATGKPTHKVCAKRSRRAA